MGHARTVWNTAAVNTETSFLIVHQTLNAELRDGFRDPYSIILKAAMPIRSPKGDLGPLGDFLVKIGPLLVPFYTKSPLSRLVNVKRY